MSDLKGRTIRLSEENWEWLDGLPGTMNEVITSLRSAPAPDSRIDETLELVRSLPDLDAIREVLELVLQEKIEERQAQRAGNPASIPGVTVGQYPPPPARRESSFERTQREAKEREQRARARSNVGDDQSYSFDPEYVQD